MTVLAIEDGETPHDPSVTILAVTRSVVVLWRNGHLEVHSIDSIETYLIDPVDFRRIRTPPEYPYQEIVFRTISGDEVRLQFTAADYFRSHGIYTNLKDATTNLWRLAFEVLTEGKRAMEDAYARYLDFRGIDETARNSKVGSKGSDEDQDTRS